MRQSTLGSYELDGTERQALRDEIRRAVGMVDHDDRDDRLRKFELLAGVVGLDRNAYESGQTFKRSELVTIRDALD